MQFQPGGQTYDQHLAAEVERMKARRKATGARRRKLLKMEDPEAVIAKAPKLKQSEMPCVIDGCTNARHARGLCGKHDKRKRRAAGLTD